MVQNSNSPSTESSSALEREAGRVDRMTTGGQNGTAPNETGRDANGLNNAVQVEQDNRVAKAKADARAAGGGPDKPEDGLNQDG